MGGVLMGKIGKIGLPGLASSNPPTVKPIEFTKWSRSPINPMEILLKSHGNPMEIPLKSHWNPIEIPWNPYFSWLHHQVSKTLCFRSQRFRGPSQDSPSPWVVKFGAPNFVQWKPSLVEVYHIIYIYILGTVGIPVVGIFVLQISQKWGWLLD